MTTAAFGLIGTTLAAATWAVSRLIPAVRAGRTLGGARVVVCPETGKAAAVRFDRPHAALTAFTRHEPSLRLADCSRWPVRGRCDQPCAARASLPDSRVTHMVAGWSEGRRCELCGTPLVESAVVGHHIGLRSPDGVTAEWPDVSPETLPDALRARQPVCWNCHVAETFRRLHPTLVTDR